MMDIIFNGKTRTLPKSISIQELLDQLRLDCLQVVVEHNHNIVPRQRLAETHLHNGDTLEVIHFVGGG
jgi:thiamine biosynthesis protein ThiS